MRRCLFHFLWNLILSLIANYSTSSNFNHRIFRKLMNELDFMDTYGSLAAYIGYTFDGTEWSWSNNDPSSYENLGI